jgi:hypothetical protein
VQFASLNNADIDCSTLFLQTIVAKELHFAFATPTAKVGFSDEECLEEGELQWAPRPRQRRVAGWSRLGGKDVAGIAVNLSVTFDRLLSEA